MVDSVGENPTVADSRLLALALLSFSAFLRFDELSHLCCLDILFEEDKMLIHIASSKTDQWREGAFVPVARSGTNTCPVKILEQYCSLGNIDNSSSERLFRALVSTKNGCSLRKSGSLSYTCMRELVRDKLSSLGYDASQYGLHSFRAGGATAAATLYFRCPRSSFQTSWKMEVRER
jgi:integrase